MSVPLTRGTVPVRVRQNTAGVGREERKPVLPGIWIYVGDFIAPGDPGNDPPLTTHQSPPWLNSFYYTSPIAFRHGVDGQTDMIGMYDLTLGAVSGDIAFQMPLPWALEMPQAALFPVELETDVWGTATQTCTIEGTPLKGNIRIFWPTVATPYP